MFSGCSGSRTRFLFHHNNEGSLVVHSLLLFSSVFSLHGSMASSWYMLCFSRSTHPPPFSFLLLFSFLLSLRKQMAFTVGYFPFHESPARYNSETTRGKCDLAKGVELDLVMPFSKLFTNHRISVKWIKRGKRGHMDGACLCFPFGSLFYFFLLIWCSFLSFPSLTSWGGSPSFQHRTPSPGSPPVCKAGVTQDKEGSE